MAVCRSRLCTFLVVTLFILSASLGALASADAIVLRVVSWIDYSNPVHLSAWQDVLDSWAEKYPDIVIDFHAMSGYWEKLPVLLTTGEVDVFDMTLNRIPEYVESGIILNLSSFMERDLDPTEFYQVSLDRGRFPHPGGDTYTAWTMMSPSVLYVNTDMFAQAGVDIPDESWRYDVDIPVIGRKLWRDVNGDGVPDQVGFGPGIGTFPGRTDYGMASILLSMTADGTGYSADGNRFALDAAEYVAAYDYAYSLVQEGISPTGWGLNQFIAGQVGMQYYGTWVAPRLQEESNFTWSMAKPIAGPYGPKVPLHGNPSMAIASDTKHPEAAWAFVKHVMESQTASNVYLAGNIPVKKEAAAEWLSIGETLWPGFNAEAASVSIENSVFIPAISVHQIEIEAEINQILQRAARGEIAFFTALEEATRLANTLMDKR